MARTLLRQLHLLASLVAGLWLATSGISGALLVYGDTLDQIIHPSLFRVDEPAHTATLDEVIEAAERVTGARAMRMRLAGEATPVHEVWVECDDCRRVWIDPSTAQVNGVRSAHGTTRTWLHELHRRMLFRGAGDIAVIIGGVAFALISLTGILLGYRGGIRLRRASFYEIHRVAGLIASPLLLVAATTGIYFITAGLRAASAPVTPVRASLDPLLVRARSEFPHATPTWIALGEREVVIRFRQTGEPHPNGRTFVRLAPGSGRVIGKTDALGSGPSRRFLDALYPLHIGRLGGPVHRAVVFALGLTPILFLLTGLVLWQRRSRAQKSRAERRLDVTMDPRLRSGRNASLQRESSRG